LFFVEQQTTTKTIEQIRNQGLNKEVMERIAAERAEMERAKQEQKERLPGQFISFKSDNETKTLFYWSVSEV